MKKRKKRKTQRPKVFKKLRSSSQTGNLLSVHSELAQIKKEVEAAGENTQKFDERIQDIEIHVNLLTRLLTTLCIEKFGMRVGVLKRMIKRIEKEAVRDSQISHLETLYKLPAPSDKKNPPSSKNDPWEEIS